MLRNTLAAALLLISTACGGGPAGPGRNEKVDAEFGTLTATFDGVRFVGTGTATASRSASFNLVSVVTGDIPLGFVFGLTTPGVLGTTSIGQVAVNATYGPLDNSTSYWGAFGSIGSGTITIKTLTETTVSGTFSFTLAPFGTASGTKTVTNGSFNTTLVTRTP